MELETAIQSYLSEMNIKTDSSMDDLKEYALCEFNGIKERIKLVEWLLNGRVGLITSFKSLEYDLGIHKNDVHLRYFTAVIDIFCPFTSADIIKILDLKRGKIILLEKNIDKAKRYIELASEIRDIINERRCKKTDDYEYCLDIDKITGH